MSEFHNTQKLWAFIKEEMFKPGDIENIYSKSCFFKDLKRSNEELYVNGILIDPFLHKARDQIYIANLAVTTILAAAKTLKENPDKIEDVYQMIASIPGIGTDLFETALLNATELLGSESDPIGVAFRSFCSIQSLVVSLDRRTLSKEGREEKYNQIKSKLLAIDLMLKKARPSIENRFLDKAADKIFNQLFKNKEETKLKSDVKNQRKNVKKECLKNFLKLSLHQNFIFPNINILNKLGAGHYSFASPRKRSIELSYTDDGLFVQVNFFTQKVFDCKSQELLKTTTDEDFFVKGLAKYKINIQPYNKNGWVAKFDLIDSSLECTEKFKTILDTRNVLEKIREFLTTCLEKIIANMTLDRPENTKKTKFKPIFFVSETGSSVSKLISDNTESCGNILNLTFDMMNR
ncbi:MAG: hypothetical protein E6K54_06460 [Gammaproteobacteria bacterium]|nr:MAG: hypothetical protein E6K54_06460 [Gammaproteobacteria bacterium]